MKLGAWVRTDTLQSSSLHRVQLRITLLQVPLIKGKELQVKVICCDVYRNASPNNTKPTQQDTYAHYVRFITGY